jgi:hypothetical protein
VRAFVPHSLPPRPALYLAGPRQQRLEQALLACGRLDGVSTLLSDPDLFLYGYIRREAVLSSQIEGTQSSLSDLLLFEAEEAPGVPFDDVEPAHGERFVTLLDHQYPSWREARAELNELPLGADRWRRRGRSK